MAAACASPTALKGHSKSSTAKRDLWGTSSATAWVRASATARKERSPSRRGRAPSHAAAGCAGSRAVDVAGTENEARSSQHSNWPIQLHLISPRAPQFTGKDVFFCADCVAYATGTFRKDRLRGKTLMIACPKLDERAEIYHEKITARIDHARINTPRS
jgi:hypothetical protein